MSKHWCELTYSLMEISTCDAALWPAIISGMFAGMLITSAIYGAIEMYRRH
jgi:hypothetical protein